MEHKTIFPVDTLDDEPSLEWQYGYTVCLELMAEAENPRERFEALMLLLRHTCLDKVLFR